jgi:hypothetical protein
MRLRLRALAIAVLIAISGCIAREPLESGSEPLAGSGGASGTEAGDADEDGRSGNGAIVGSDHSGGAAGDAVVMAGIGGVGGTGAGGMFAEPIGGTSGSPDQGGVGGTVIVEPPRSCETASEHEPLIARDGETCYELLASDDDGVSPFQVPLAESFNQFYYDIPWPDGTVATRFGSQLDNREVIFRWLAFEGDFVHPNGPSRNVPGTTLFENAKVIGGWAMGGCNVELPEDVGLELADPGTKRLMVQFHHANYTGEVQQDASKIQICTVPRAERAHIAAITRLGTEDFGGGDGIPTGMERTFSGTCLNETSEAVHIVHFWPHMHEIGTRMYSEILRVDGSVTVAFDRPFVFDRQPSYEMLPRVVLEPGDKIRSECTYVNTTPQNVSFGQSVKQEICEQYAFAYPAGALDNPQMPSLLGATNTCWGE